MALVHASQKRRPEWRIFAAGILATALFPLVLHTQIENNKSVSQQVGRQLSVATVPHPYHPHNAAIMVSPHKKDRDDDETHDDSSPKQRKQQHVNNQKNDTSVLRDAIQKASKQAEKQILDFFQGETRALQDGVHSFHENNSTSHPPRNFLVKRLAHRMNACQNKNVKSLPAADIVRPKHDDAVCTLKVVFVGSAQMSGRDNFYNQSYPFFVEDRLKPIAEAAGLELQVFNHALDSDLSREGPQTTHMCIGNLAGTDTDVVVWDLDGSMQAKPPAQVEAFLRWTMTTAKPAMMIFNRGGPHGRSRRGKQRVVVNLGPGHDAFVFEDDVNNMPEAHQEVYRGSLGWKEQWKGERNFFWEPMFQRYASILDIAAIDPIGSIHHLDHLEAFSNQAFEAEKVLPLVDCGKEHPPPCNQIPDFVEKHLKRAKLTVNDLPEDDGGKICWSKVGCRHAWYGGKKSHQLRAALNVLPIMRALQTAAATFPDLSTQNAVEIDQRALSETLSMMPPEFCAKAFCGLTPTCFTSYVPNFGLDLGAAIVPEETSPVSMPRKGASHFADDPDFQIENIDQRYSPLGYIDRKFAYHLSAEDTENKAQTKHMDASTTVVSFPMSGPGPVVLCEPPCFIDACSKHRMKPLVKYVTLELDGEKLEVSQYPPAVVEVGGPFCRIITPSAKAGHHNLRITSRVAAPEHVMFSHVITFS